MTSFEKLIQYFERFPGIGSRQARRFANHLLNIDDASLKELSDLIANIKTAVVQCPSCYRYFSKNGGGDTCSICINNHRDHQKLMVVEQDSDIQSVERSGTYDGLYFVLGGTAPLLNSSDDSKVRGGTLKHIVEERQKDLTEIILAFAVNPDGENTARYVEKLLKNITDANKIAISQLGRGLSTGSELEYADPETTKNALQNRH